jgi:hypothetical protein
MFCGAARRYVLERYDDQLRRRGKAWGERVIIRSLRADSVERRTVVKLEYLNCLTIDCSSVSPQLPSRAHCHRLHRRKRKTHPAPYLFTASLNALPAVNLTVFDAAI